MKANISILLSLSFCIGALVPLHAEDDAASITEVVVGPILIASGAGLCCLGGWCLKLSRGWTKEVDRTSKSRNELREDVVRDAVDIGCSCAALPCVVTGCASSCAGTLLTAAGVALTTMGAIQLSKNNS